MKNNCMNKTQEICLINPKRKSKITHMASFKSNKPNERGELDENSKEPKTPLIVLKEELGSQKLKLKTKFVNKSKNIKSYDIGKH